MIVGPGDVNVLTKQLDLVWLGAWHVVGLTAAVAAPILVFVLNPSPRAVVAQRLLMALVASAVKRLSLIAIVGASAARAREF